MGENGFGWRNELPGTVGGHSVQAGQIYGGVHLHTGPPAPTALAQLPLPPARFTNRQGELARFDQLLAESLERPGPALAVVVGTAGVGKSALGCQWLHSVRDRFPDGQLHADLRGFSPQGSAEPTEVLAGFLAALGIERIPAGLAELKACFRSATAGKRLALLLDNAATATQVRALLPGPGAHAVVVTSRFLLAGLTMDGGRLVAVEPLATEPAVELVAYALGDNRVAGDTPAARQLVDLCGRLPIAVEVVAARLASRPDWPLSRMVQLLADERNRLAALHDGDDTWVRAAFDLSYSQLSIGAARLYRLLGLHPGTEFSAATAAALAGGALADVLDPLDELVHASLLDETGQDRYRVHDLLMLYARERVEAEQSGQERSVVLDRALDWYLTNAQAAALRLTPARQGLTWSAPGVVPLEFSCPATAMAWLETERVNLLAVVRTALPTGRPEVGWRLASALWSFFHLRKYYQDWVEVDQLGLECARSCQDQAAEAEILREFGLGLRELGRFEEAADRFTESMRIWQRLGDARRVASCWERIGMVRADQGRHAEAAEIFRRCLAVLEPMNDPRRTALVRVNLAEALIETGDPAGALRELDQARSVLGGLDEPYNQARAQTIEALARAVLGQHPAAQELLARAGACMLELASVYGQATVAEAAGRAAELAGDLAAAGDHYRQALELLERLGAHAVERVRQRLEQL